MDTETRRKKQQALMVQLVERKVRSRAKQLYETRGKSEGQDCRIGFRLSQKCLIMSILRRSIAVTRRAMRSPGRTRQHRSLSSQDASACEYPA